MSRKVAWSTVIGQLKLLFMPQLLMRDFFGAFPIQASASSEEPASSRMFQFNKVSGSQRRGDQDTRYFGEQDHALNKRIRVQSGDELDTEPTEQEQLPAKRRRNQLFSIQDIIAAERGEQGDQKHGCGACACMQAVSVVGCTGKLTTRCTCVRYCHSKLS
jgi:hypothetical protein